MKSSHQILMSCVATKVRRKNGTPSHPTTCFSKSRFVLFEKLCHWDPACYFSAGVHLPVQASFDKMLSQLIRLELEEDTNIPM